MKKMNSLGSFFVQRPKIFVGFSDITALSTYFYQRFRQKTIYGPMLNKIAQGKVSKNSEKAVFEAVFGQKMEFSYEISTIFAKSKAKISGTLVGGCIAVILQGFATENELNFGGKILFLEDVFESGEKIERAFMQILQIAKCKNSLPKAILLGNFTQSLDNKQKIIDIKQAITSLGQKIKEDGLNIAVFEEKSGCLGHSDTIMPLVIGGEVEIAEGTMRLI